MSKITSEKLVMDRQTKGTVLYKSVSTNDPAIRNIYIAKHAFEGEFPGEIEVIVNRLDDEG